MVVIGRSGLRRHLHISLEPDQLAPSVKAAYHIAPQAKAIAPQVKPMAQPNGVLSARKPRSPLASQLTGPLILTANIEA